MKFTTFSTKYYNCFIKLPSCSIKFQPMLRVLSRILPILWNFQPALKCSQLLLWSVQPFERSWGQPRTALFFRDLLGQAHMAHMTLHAILRSGSSALRGRFNCVSVRQSVCQSMSFFTVHWDSLKNDQKHINMGFNRGHYQQLGSVKRKLPKKTLLTFLKNL